MGSVNPIKWETPIPLLMLGPKLCTYTADFNVFGYDISKDWIMDGASVPDMWVTRGVVPRWGYRFWIPHDMHYERLLKEWFIKGADWEYVQKERKEADKEMLSNMRKDGLSRMASRIGYTAVREFGWKSFRKADRLTLLGELGLEIT